MSERRNSTDGRDPRALRLRTAKAVVELRGPAAIVAADSIDMDYVVRLLARAA